MRTPLIAGIALNDKTTLQREWITVRDTVLPIDFVGTPGIATTYKPGGEYSSGTYEYGTKFRLTVKDSITAFEVRFVVFDVWGDPVRTLSETEIEDVPVGSSHDFEPQWNLYSENEASEYYASIAFVARVRTKNGKVYVANMDPILTEAAKFSRKFTAADLEPRAPTRP